jgi:hypothetical protein
MKLKAGLDGKAKLQVKGRGSNLSVPTPPFALPVTAQLLAIDGSGTTCWQTIYSAAMQNVGGKFRSKGP